MATAAAGGGNRGNKAESTACRIWEAAGIRQAIYVAFTRDVFEICRIQLLCNCCCCRCCCFGFLGMPSNGTKWHNSPIIQLSEIERTLRSAPNTFHAEMCRIGEASSLPKSFVWRRQVKGSQAASLLSLSLSLCGCVYVVCLLAQFQFRPRHTPKLKTAAIWRHNSYRAWRDVNRERESSFDRQILVPARKMPWQMVDGRSAKWPKWPGQHRCIIIIPAVRQSDAAMRCDAVAFMANLIVAISMQAL